MQEWVCVWGTWNEWKSKSNRGQAAKPSGNDDEWQVLNFIIGYISHSAVILSMLTLNCTMTITAKSFFVKQWPTSTLACANSIYLNTGHLSRILKLIQKWTYLQKTIAYMYIFNMSHDHAMPTCLSIWRVCWCNISLIWCETLTTSLYFKQNLIRISAWKVYRINICNICIYSRSKVFS